MVTDRGEAVVCVSDGVAYGDLSNSLSKVHFPTVPGDPEARVSG